ncbi:MAG: hypothetical protein R3B49_01875 [Phycisphaerales bacterium]
MAALALTGIARFVLTTPPAWAWLDVVFLLSAAVCVATLVSVAARHIANTFGPAPDHHEPARAQSDRAPATRNASATRDAHGSE